MRFGNSLESILRMQRELDAVMASDWFGATTSSSGAFPPINVFRHEGGYVVIAELPGVDKKSIDIEINRDKLRISGHKQIDYGEGASVHRRERRSGSFDRTLTLPFTVGVDQVEAEYRDGLLALRLPPADADRPQKVSVN